MSTILFLIYFPDFLTIFLDFLKHFLWLDLDPDPWIRPLRTMNYLFSPDFWFIVPDFLSTRKRSFQNLYTFVCLYWKPMLLLSCHPNLSCCIHPIHAGFWWGRWWNRCLNITGTIQCFACEIAQWISRKLVCTCNVWPWLSWCHSLEGWRLKVERWPQQWTLEPQRYANGMFSFSHWKTSQLEPRHQFTLLTFHFSPHETTSHKGPKRWSLQGSTIRENRPLILHSSTQVEFLIYSGCSPWIYSNSTYWVLFSARNSEKSSIPTSHVQQREYHTRWPSSPSFCCIASSPVRFLVEEPSLDRWRIFFISQASSELIPSFHIDGAIDPPHFYHSHDNWSRSTCRRCFFEAICRSTGCALTPPRTTTQTSSHRDRLSGKVEVFSTLQAMLVSRYRSIDMIQLVDAHNQAAISCQSEWSMPLQQHLVLVGVPWRDCWSRSQRPRWPTLSSIKSLTLTSSRLSLRLIICLTSTALGSTLDLTSNCHGWAHRMLFFLFWKLPHLSICSGGKSGAATIQTDDEFHVTLGHLLSKPKAKCMVSVEFDLDNMTGFRIQQPVRHLFLFFYLSDIFISLAPFSGGH